MALTYIMHTEYSVHGGVINWHLNPIHLIIKVVWQTMNSALWRDKITGRYAAKYTEYINVFKKLTS